MRSWNGPPCCVDGRTEPISGEDFDVIGVKGRWLRGSRHANQAAHNSGGHFFFLAGEAAAAALPFFLGLALAFFLSLPCELLPFAMMPTSIWKRELAAFPIRGIGEPLPSHGENESAGSRQRDSAGSGIRTHAFRGLA